MPGRMGHTNVTCLNLRVWKVEPRFNLVYVVGQVPGAKETFVRVRDAMRKKFLVPPPFPTYLPSVHVCCPLRLSSAYTKVLSLSC
jgi:large subunit ribosomal protein L3